MTRASLFHEASALGATLLLAAAALACSEGSDDGATTGTGGSEEEGTGGTTNGTGGTVTAGSTSIGGSTAAAGAPAATPRWTFDSDQEGWNIEWIENFEGQAGAGGAGTTAGDVASLSWDGDVGDPERGSLRLEGQYTAKDQKVQVQINLDSAEDLTDRIITARVYLDSGLAGSEEDPGGAMLFTKTGDDWVWGDGGWHNLTSGAGWTEIRMEASVPAAVDENAPSTYDATQVRAIGVHVATGSNADAVWEPAVVHIDTISY
jgi:hypothetical protein